MAGWSSAWKTHWTNLRNQDSVLTIIQFPSFYVKIYL